MRKGLQYRCCFPGYPCNNCQYVAACWSMDLGSVLFRSMFEYGAKVRRCPDCNFCDVLEYMPVVLLAPVLLPIWFVVGLMFFILFLPVDIIVHTVWLLTGCCFRKAMPSGILCASRWTESRVTGRKLVTDKHGRDHFVDKYEIVAVGPWEETCGCNRQPSQTGTPSPVAPAPVEMV
jgi:hypothetical protein